MVMPHQIQFKLIKKRLKGLEGKAKLKEIGEIRQELPGFNTGPYGEIKSWLTEEVKKTKTRLTLILHNCLPNIKPIFRMKMDKLIY